MKDRYREARDDIISLTNALPDVESDTALENFKDHLKELSTAFNILQREMSFYQEIINEKGEVNDFALTASLNVIHLCIDRATRLCSNLAFQLAENNAKPSLGDFEKNKLTNALTSSEKLVNQTLDDIGSEKSRVTFIIQKIEQKKPIELEIEVHQPQSYQSKSPVKRSLLSKQLAGANSPKKIQETYLNRGLLGINRDKKQLDIQYNNASGVFEYALDEFKNGEAYNQFESAKKSHDQFANIIMQWKKELKSFNNVGAFEARLAEIKDQHLTPMMRMQTLADEALSACEGLSDKESNSIKKAVNTCFQKLETQKTPAKEAFVSLYEELTECSKDAKLKEKIAPVLEENERSYNSFKTPPESTKLRGS